jgi:hypothetical protein
MTSLSAYHSAPGGTNFLGLRRNRKGAIEIVYDDGVARRLVWRVASPDISETRLGDALRVAVNQPRVVPALYAELKRRSIMVESIVR